MATTSNDTLKGNKAFSFSFFMLLVCGPYKFFCSREGTIVFFSQKLCGPYTFFSRQREGTISFSLVREISEVKENACFGHSFFKWTGANKIDMSTFFNS